MELLAEDLGKQEDPGQPAESGERPYFAGDIRLSSRAPTRDFVREGVTWQFDIHRRNNVSMIFFS